MIPSEGLPIFVDIDGTLTNSPKGGGAAIPERVAVVKRLIAEGKEIVIWSTGGTVYAREFCRVTGIEPVAAIGKPEGVVDDNVPRLKDRRIKEIPMAEFFR